MPDIALTTILENVFSKVILSGEIGCAELQKEKKHPLLRDALKLYIYLHN